MTTAPAVRIWASVTTVDLGELVDTAQALQEAGVDGIHVDVSDGVFAPDLTFGARVVRVLTSRTSLPVEAHLMVTTPEEQLRAVADAGATQASFHFEATAYPWRLAHLARSLGLGVGVAINPATSLAPLEYLASGIDFVNVLTTEPDGHGERFLPQMYKRVAAVRALLEPTCRVEADGGVDTATMPELVRAGASDVVVGRALVDSADSHRALANLRSAAHVL
jgi:ribulose-phosphate 3-epimerase